MSVMKTAKLKKKMLLTMLKKSTDGNFQNSSGQEKDDVLHGNAV